MDNENKEDQPNVQADNNSIAVGGINIGGDISGNITIGNTGYTVEQVSVLLTQITSTFQPKPFDGRCPYKGLDVFEEEDADLFFGRERLVEDLVSRVEESRTVFITGPSGSGKSSLVRAGLLHALKQGAIKNLHSERWLYEAMKPGREPIKDLALAFSRLKSPDLADYFQAHASEMDVLNKCAESVLSGRKDQHFVLFIDQFEEVFTQISQEEVRIAFINMLAHAGTIENGRVIVLFAMRSDFVSNCATYPALNEMLSQQFRQIGAMQPEELVSAIALPANHVGLPIEDELIARIINDMKGEPGALPLMQFALKDLFDSQQEKGGVIALTLEDYLRHGGIHKSLERHADKSFATLSENEQELARSIFSGLIEIGRGTQDTRRTALFAELVPANAKAAEVESVVQRLADARLIITDEQAGKDTVTISHEKLIDAWPWLKKLVNENRDVIALQNEIKSDAKEWDDHKRDASYLYTGARLATAHEQLQAKKLVLSGSAYEFVRAGSTQQKRRQRTTKLGVAVIGVALTVAVAVFSIQSSNNAKIASTAQAANTEAVAQKATAQAASTLAVQQAQISRAGELAAQSVDLRDTNFPVTLLLGIEAFNIRETIQSYSVLMDNAQTNPQLKTYLSGGSRKITSLVFSPDPEGKTLALASLDGTIILWDIETRQPIGQQLGGPLHEVKSVAFSPDGKTLVSSGCGMANMDFYCGRGEIIFWDVETGQPIGPSLSEHMNVVYSVVFSPDGKTLVSGGSDGTIILWDLETRQPVGEPLSGHTQSVSSLALSPDGKTLASASCGKDGFAPGESFERCIEGEIILWDMETRQPIGQPLSGHTDQVTSIVFSPDPEEKTLASGSSDGTIILWDVETRQLMGQPLSGHTDSVDSVVFSPNGKMLASGSWDRSIILWDVKTGQTIGQPLSGHTDWVSSVAFGPDGKTLVSGGWDGTIILWDIERRQPVGRELGNEIAEKTGWTISVAFSSDGKTLVSGGCRVVYYENENAGACGGEEVNLWDLEKEQLTGQLLNGYSGINGERLSGGISSVAFGSDKKTLYSLSSDGTIIVWDMETRQPVGQPLRGNTWYANTLPFSPDGKTLASDGGDNTVILWNVETGQPIGQPLSGHTDDVSSLVFSPDGKTLASGSSDDTIILWNVETGQPIGQRLSGHTGSVDSVVFSPDGKTLASGSSSGSSDDTIILWDVKTGQAIGQPLTALSGSVTTVAFSPDGKTLVSGGWGGTIILWDVKTGQAIGQLLSVLSGRVNIVAFSPDGKTLVSGGDDRKLILLDMDPLSWIQKTCERVGRNFSRAEWERYFPNEEYRKTCEQWPLEPEVMPTAAP